MIEVDGREPIEIPGWHHYHNLRHEPFVYRCYDDAGALLYVGITQQLPTRFLRHSRGMTWWPDVARYSLTPFKTRPEAEVAEQRAIHQEVPRYNVRRPGHQARLIRWCGGGDK